MSAPPIEELEKVAIGQADLRVDVGAIEKSLADLWRGHSVSDSRGVLTRAALWNVVAHTSNAESHAIASEALGKASAAVPQRSIVIRSDPSAAPEMSTWISVNCHLVGDRKQVCSEEIDIVASGDRIYRVPPIMNALLIPDMPVAFWWLGDLPNQYEDYVEALLEPADRLIVDSVCFDDSRDLALLARVAERTTTAPADLNWVRLEEWRTATASAFDSPVMRDRLRSMRRVRVIAGTSDDSSFGQTVESLYFAAWLCAQANHQVDREGDVQGMAGAIDYRFERRLQSTEIGGIVMVEIQFDDGSYATISRDRDAGVLKANVDGLESLTPSVTRTLGARIEELIVRQLKCPRADSVFVKMLPLATRLSRRFKR